MDIVAAHKLLCSLPVEKQQELLPIKPKNCPHARKLWGYAAVAAADLSGMLDDCLTVADLGEAIAHFETCRSAGIVSGKRWELTMLEVAKRLRRPARRKAVRQLAPGTPRNDRPDR